MVHRQFFTDLPKQISTIQIVAKYDNNINLLKFTMNFFNDFIYKMLLF